MQYAYYTIQVVSPPEAYSLFRHLLAEERMAVRSMDDWRPCQTSLTCLVWEGERPCKRCTGVDRGGHVTNTAWHLISVWSALCPCTCWRENTENIKCEISSHSATHGPLILLKLTQISARSSTTSKSIKAQLLGIKGFFLPSICLNFCLHLGLGINNNTCL